MAGFEEVEVFVTASMTLVERLRLPLCIEYAVPIPVEDALQRAADERDEAADALETAENALEEDGATLFYIYETSDDEHVSRKAKEAFDWNRAALEKIRSGR